MFRLTHTSPNVLYMAFVSWHMSNVSGRSLRTASTLIRRNHKYEEPLPNKAIHKFLYFVDKKARDQNLEIPIPYFWYQFGTLSPVTQGATPGEIEEPELASQLEPLVQDVLQEYYSTSLEELTDRMYEDAPYDVQRDWRELDKKIRTLHPEYHDFYEVEPSRDSVIQSIYAVYDSFPKERYLQESDVTKWYSMMTRELYDDEFDVGRLMTINLTFWRMFALWLAENHRHRLSEEEVKAILSIGSFEEARETGRERLRAIESDALAEKFDGEEMRGTPRAKAADAVVRSLIDQSH